MLLPGSKGLSKATSSGVLRPLQQGGTSKEASKGDTLPKAIRAAVAATKGKPAATCCKKPSPPASSHTGSHACKDNGVMQLKPPPAKELCSTL
jgi:hypothetical protein